MTFSVAFIMYDLNLSFPQLIRSISQLVGLAVLPWGSGALVLKTGVQKGG